MNLFFKTGLLFTFSIIGVALFSLSFSKNKTSKAFFRQLYLFQETFGKDPCKSTHDLENKRFGAFYFTEKGNIIYNETEMNGDTVRYFWGKYTTTSATITYTLENEFYYPGKWDARWVLPEPDYKKGKSRKIKSVSKTLNKVNCKSTSYVLPYSATEQKEALKRTNGIYAYGLSLFPYEETKDMKFYSWFYKQIPELAGL